MVYLLKMVIFHGYFNNQMVWKVIGCTMMYPPEICYMSWKITMFENRFFLGTEWAMASTNYQVLHWETFVIKPLEISLCVWFGQSFELSEWKVKETSGTSRVGPPPQCLSHRRIFFWCLLSLVLKRRLLRVALRCLNHDHPQVIG